MKFNKTVHIAVALLFLTNFAWAQEDKTQLRKGENAIQKITTEAKKTRKKKVEMCPECGKPESECECHGKDKREHKEAAPQK